MIARRALLCILALAALVATIASCADTPTPTPLRTFERAQRVDFVCVRVRDIVNGVIVDIPPEPALPAQCAPPSVGVESAFHLLALVTQSTRGELAVVDLTSGYVVDLDRESPGINFLPVGSLPVDVAAAPDGTMAFVAAAEVNKPAIYAIPSKAMYGDSLGVPVDQRFEVTLPSWPVCALPQAPIGLVTVPLPAGTLPPSGAPADADGGSGDAGVPGDAGASADGGTGESADGGAAEPEVAPSFGVAVLLAGDSRSKAKIALLDPRPFARGAGIDKSTGTTVAPGSLTPCPVLAAIELASAAALPTGYGTGATWPSGVDYAPALPAVVPASPTPESCAIGTTASPTSGAPIADGGAPSDAGAPAAETPFVESAAQGVDARPTGIVSDGRFLYIADASLPVVHVVDSSKGVLEEVSPLLVTSALEPGRRANVRDLAVSGTTRDYLRYLYGVDTKDGTIVVYDVTTPGVAPGNPLRRPHPEINPFQAPDRIVLGAPVATLAFAKHDWPLAPADGRSAAAGTGILCNPNPEAAATEGAAYRANVDSPIGPGLGPARLRGVFAFATMTNGQVAIIDVDDWDAPCRRPDAVVASLSGEVVDGNGNPIPASFASRPSSITPDQPLAAAGDLDPYHAPTTFKAGQNLSVVSQEAFFPMSAPHRLRSALIVRADSPTGNQLPRIQSVPQLLLQGAPQVVVGDGSEENPSLVPTSRGDRADPLEVQQPSLPDPFLRAQSSTALPPPNVRFSYEAPDVHLNQEWVVAFEGEIPGFNGLSTVVSSDDGDQTLGVAQPNALFCRRGVEDFRIGQARAQSMAKELAAKNLPAANLERKIGDYVQVTDELLPPEDSYWSSPNACWGDLGSAAQRYDACNVTFGAPIQPGDERTDRDFPILEAYEDHLRLGRFAAPAGETLSTSSRVIVSRDPSNVARLRLARCCFHDRMAFRVRAANQWVAFGGAVGLLHHVRQGTGGACVLSCDPREALLNSRAPAVPRGRGTDGSPVFVAIDRDSALALRNPMFSVVMANGITRDAGGIILDTYPKREMQWRFVTAGGFSPLVINIAASTISVSPQSMRFVDSFGQVALVDGASQGLVLFDLSVVGFAHAPYF